MVDIFKAQLHVDFFKEGDMFIAHCQSIDLSTCGKTFGQAKKRFDEAANIFFKEIIEMGTLEEVLLECGWRKAPSKSSTKQPTFIPPTFIGQEDINVAYPQ